MGWVTLESDPGVFTYLMEELGVKGVQVEEVFSLDEAELQRIQPLYGLIFLFKWESSEDMAKKYKLDNVVDTPAPLSDTESEGIFFARQVINNACATQALLSILFNSPEIDLGDNLSNFREFTLQFPSEMRGEALGGADHIAAVHNSFARSDPFISDEVRQATEDDDVYHFIAYTHVHGQLLELDGLKSGPIPWGPCTETEFPKKVSEVISNRINQQPGEIRFNLLALCRDLRITLRENLDTEPTNELLLQMEDAKRTRWSIENDLRKHNFIGFINALTKSLIKTSTEEKDGYQNLIKSAQEELLKRRMKDLHLQGKK